MDVGTDFTVRLRMPNRATPSKPALGRGAAPKIEAGDMAGIKRPWNSSGWHGIVRSTRYPAFRVSQSSIDLQWSLAGRNNVGSQADVPNGSKDDCAKGP